MTSSSSELTEGVGLSAKIEMMEKRDPIEHTRRWISSMVIGLNLCPFAERVFKAERIRYVLTSVSNSTELLLELGTELQVLASSHRESVETTFLIHPHALKDFLDYNDFLSPAEELVQNLGLRGTVQVVGFHPNYQFEGTVSAAAENYTNRSPYPMLHLLREQSISEIGINKNEMLDISRRNIETLNQLGIETILQRLKSVV